MATKNTADLLVFGYACKIFRDDEKALHVDQGKHLIPWMGNNALKIDRYDVRATLSDVSQFEAPPGGYANRLDYLSAAEQRAEQLCEEERYFSLYNNDFEEELYKEENQKRGTTGYGQIGFNYDDSSPTQNGANEKAENDVKDETPDEAYVPHHRFYIPPNMELPETTKVQAIIEKTARFISTQGPQMEILIKAKQANNPLFDFLNQSGRLNPFYKHTLQAMKDGNYPEDHQETENTQTNEITGSMYQSYYSSNTPTVAMPAIKYKPSADCAYTQLITKIKGVHEQAKVPTSVPHQTVKVHAKNEQKTDVEVKKISNGLMLAQYYNSDSEDEEENQDNHSGSNALDNNNVHSRTLPHENSQSSVRSIPTLSPETPIPIGVLCPPPELRAIIEKTASYVLKNGKEFEDILRTKNDQRFIFLQYTDPYYKYYTFKLTGMVCPDANSSNGTNANELEEKPKNSFDVENKKSRTFDISKPINPVSFSIKSKEDTASTSLKPALPIDHSSDEEIELESNNKIEQSSLTTPVAVALHPSINDKSSNEVSLDVEQSDSFIRDTILEQQNLNEKKLVKRAEDKIKDRLTQLAREKLGILSKEKLLQLERKRRAMAFLNQINGEDIESKSVKIDEVPSSSIEITSTELKVENISDHSDSSDSVTFVSASSATSICASATRIVQKQRNIRSVHKSNESEHPRSKSRSRSRSTSSRQHRHKTKRSEKKSTKRLRSQSRSESRSRSSRHDYKRKTGGSSSKARKRRNSED